MKKTQEERNIQIHLCSSYFICNLGTTVLLPCLAMLQRVSKSYKGHQISEKFNTNEEVNISVPKKGN